MEPESPRGAGAAARSVLSAVDAPLLSIAVSRLWVGGSGDGYSKTSSELADLDPNVAVCHKPFTGNTLREHVARLLKTSSPR